MCYIDNGLCPGKNTLWNNVEHVSIHITSNVPAWPFIHILHVQHMIHLIWSRVAHQNWTSNASTLFQAHFRWHGFLLAFGISQCARWSILIIAFNAKHMLCQLGLFRVLYICVMIRMKDWLMWRRLLHDFWSQTCIAQIFDGKTHRHWGSHRHIESGK